MDFMRELDVMPKEKQETRWFTFENQKGERGEGGKVNFGRKGAPLVAIPTGTSLTLCEINGESGKIRRIWATLCRRDPSALRGLRIEMYWDDAETPAVNAPFGDFFCQTMGQFVPFENALFASPEGRSFVCTVPMPFKKSAKIVLHNESGDNNTIYYEINCTLGDDHPDEIMYFHSYWRRENMTALREDMTLLPHINGKGRFLGCNIGFRLNPEMDNFWWGEGEVKIYLDGDSEYPTLCGTGTEDYISTGFGQGLFSQMYQGNPYKSPDDKPKAFGFYRFHIPDPVYFYEEIRATLQVMGGTGNRKMLEAMYKTPGLKFMKAGDGTQYFPKKELETNINCGNLTERTDDVSCTTYWYMSAKENTLGPIAEFFERVEDIWLLE